jgi:hypothetical protein
VALPDTPQQQLDWEARQRPRAAIAAALAGLLILPGRAGEQALVAGQPSSSFADSLSRAAQPGPMAELPSLQVPAAQYFADRTFEVLASSIAAGLGFIALAYAAMFLAAATRARRAKLSRWAMYLPAIGGVLVGAASIGQGLGRIVDVNAFLDSSRTVGAAEDIGFSGLSLISAVLFYPASLALAIGLIIVSLNAMRAGLLTRFMGTLGIIVGVLQVIEIGPIPLVQTFWLVSLAVLFAGRRPAGDPPAWRTGREEPWPAPEPRGGRRAPAPEPEAGPDPEPAAAERVPAGAHPASSKRKRKRRG